GGEDTSGSAGKSPLSAQGGRAGGPSGDAGQVGAERGGAGEGGGGTGPTEPDPVCVNGGTLVRPTSTTAACSCTAGFWGKECELTTVKLGAGPASCALLSNGTIRCWG